MTKPWRLTKAAEASLIDIARWTIASFGPRQAAAYEDDLIARCNAIASGTAPSQDCRRIIDPDLPENLRFARAGQHYVILIEDAEKVVIIDVLHSRADLPKQLAAFSPTKTDRDQ